MKRSRSAGLIVFTSFTLFGQSPLPLAPGFEVASVRRDSPGDSRGATFEFTPGGGLQVTAGTLRGIIETAYDVRDFQISGGPGWLNSERYDISAKSGARDPLDGVNETRRKLQALLAERFQLKVHRETRELPVYALVTGKGGAKLIAAEASNQTGSARAGIRRECGQMTGTLASMANLTIYLARQLDRPVLDRTGLPGKYNFQLEWTPDAGPCSSPASDAPSIFTALEQQLGLKLESIRGPVEIVAIDHVERADDN